MTSNATAATLLALYQAVGEEQGASAKDLRGTIQNDILKEYIARGTYIYPPAGTPSRSAAITCHVAESPGGEPRRGYPQPEKLRAPGARATGSFPTGVAHDVP